MKRRSRLAPPPVCTIDTDILHRVHTGLLALAPRGPAARLVDEAQRRGYTAHQYSAGPRPVVGLTARSGQGGRVELVTAPEVTYWRWWDTGDVLAAPPSDPATVVTELDIRLRPSQSRAGGTQG